MSLREVGIATAEVQQQQEQLERQGGVVAGYSSRGVLGGGEGGVVGDIEGGGGGEVDGGECRVEDEVKGGLLQQGVSRHGVVHYWVLRIYMDMDICGLWDIFTNFVFTILYPVSYYAMLVGFAIGLQYYGKKNVCVIKCKTRGLAVSGVFWHIVWILKVTCFTFVRGLVCGGVDGFGVCRNDFFKVSLCVVFTHVPCG